MAATKKAKTVKKRRRFSRFTAILIMLAVLAVLVAAALFMRRAYESASEGQGNRNAESSSVFAVKEITVSGNTRYLPEAIIQQSGLYVGKSIWSVDKSEAARRVQEAFPYVESVKVENTAYNKYNIALTETREIGVMYGAGQWLSVGANGKILNARPVDSDRPLRALYLKGADPVGDEPGEQAMSERCFSIVTELLEAFNAYGLTGVGEIDLSNKSDLRVTVNGRILVRLGGDANLTHEIGVAVSALPAIEQQYGVGASGQLDVSAFSEKGGGERAVFTPRELLPTTAPTTLPTGEEPGETGPEGTAE